MSVDLHFFRDVKLSKSIALARAIDALDNFKITYGANKGLFLAFLGSSVFLSAATVRMASLVSGGVVSIALLLLVLQIVFSLMCFVSFTIAKRISKRFRCKLDTGIRDSWFFLSAFNIYIVCLLPVGWKVLVALFLASGAGAPAVMVLLRNYYEKNIAVKKQPDLDIPAELDADEAVDIEITSDADRKKVQIEGDTRDAFLLEAGGLVRFTVPEGTGRIKFAVGLRESMRSSNPEGTLIKVYEESEKEAAKLVYSKELDHITDHNARRWIDVDLILPEDPAEGRRKFLVRAESDCIERRAANDKYCCFAGPRVSGSNTPKKIILVVLDAVRSDHLGCYGYDKGITPNIDMLAEGGVKFDTAIVQGEWTLPSFMSMLSGLYPSAHNVYHHSSYHTLDKKYPTLTELLKKRGFITRNFFTHKRLMSHFGFARGFDSHLFRQCDKEWNIATADDVTDRALDMLTFHNDDDMFLMLHYFDTHQPCDPPTPYSEMFDKLYGKKLKKNVRQILLDKKDSIFDEKDLRNLIARYDAEIMRADAKIGMIVEHLQKTGQYDESMIIVTADHGMLLNDHGSMTEITLFDETVRVPLIVKYPASLRPGKGVTVTDTIAEANIDLMPTILDVCGVTRPEHLQGKSLFGLEKPELASSRETKDYALSESLFGNSYTLSLRDKDYRYMFKADFDISDFKNYASNNVEELAYKVRPGSAELKVESEEFEALQKKYSPILTGHIEKVLKMHG